MTTKPNSELDVLTETETHDENTDSSSFSIFNMAITMLNLEKSDPGLAEKSIQLDEDKHKVFFNFFKEHIDQTRSGKRTRECKFLDADNAVLAKINRYLQEPNDENFLTFSNEITKALFEIMKTATKSSGSFFILHAIYNEEEFIVFLKLDPKDGVQLTDTLDLKKIENMLPESGDRVHKCALIKTEYKEGDTNLFVLDRQQKAGETTKFFMDTFLQSIATPNDNMKTINSMKELSTFLENQFPDLKEEVIERAIQPEFTNGATVHLPNAIENIYERILPKDMPDRDIRISQSKTEFVNLYTTKYRSYGLSFIVDRNEDKVFYTSKSRQIYFRYDKVLDDNEVIIDHNKEDNIYTITIHNNESLGFDEDKR